MEDKKLNEKESLELITQMIQNTRRNLDAGSGNMFLLWGYVCVVVTLIVFAGLHFTQNLTWMWGFWGIPVIGYLLTYFLMRKQQKPVKMYGDKVLNEIWMILGVFCMAIAVWASITKSYELILPFCVILMSLGSIFTGCIIRYKAFSGFPSFGVVLGLQMLFNVWEKTFSYWILLEFALAIMFALVIPGHILNYKARKDMSKGK